jgi:hypothetical protein
VIFEVAITLSMLFDVCVGWMGRRREEEREMKGQREGKRAVLIPRSSPPVPSFPQLDTPLAPHQQCSYSVAMSFAQGRTRKISDDTILSLPPSHPAEDLLRETFIEEEPHSRTREAEDDLEDLISCAALPSSPRWSRTDGVGNEGFRCTRSCRVGGAVNRY